MILSLFGFLLSISLVLISIGLFRPSESAQALIGFSFLFLLSMVILTGQLQYETGANVNSTYSYDGYGNVNGTSQNIGYSYINFSDSNSHFIGFWLAIISVLSFIFTLMSINRSRKQQEGDF